MKHNLRHIKQLKHIKYIKIRPKILLAPLLVLSVLLSIVLPAAPLFATNPPTFNLLQSSGRPGQRIDIAQGDPCPALPTGFDSQHVKFTFVDANNVQTDSTYIASVDASGDWQEGTILVIPWRDVVSHQGPIHTVNAAAVGMGAVQARCVAVQYAGDDMDPSDDITQTTQTYAPAPFNVAGPSLEFSLSSSSIVTGKAVRLTSIDPCVGDEVHGSIISNQAVSNFYTTTDANGHWSVDVQALAEDMGTYTDFPAGEYEVNAMCMNSDPYTTHFYGEKTIHVRGPNYVAMGDSYSSGEGIEPFEPGTEDGCHRSSSAYPRLLANSLTPSLSLGSDGFAACAGATTANIASQMNAVTADTELITMTIGGNDMDFKGFAESCVGYIVNDCSGTPKDDAIARISSNVIPNVRSMLEDLRDRLVLLGNTDAKVLVVGYPQILPEISANCEWLNSQQETDAIRHVTSTLNTAVKNEVLAIGYDFHFVSATDTGSPFIGHELCRPLSSTDPAYFFGPLVAPSMNYSFHPNAGGQQAYKQLIANYLSTHP